MSSCLSAQDLSCYFNLIWATSFVLDFALWESPPYLVGYIEILLNWCMWLQKWLIRCILTKLKLDLAWINSLGWLFFSQSSWQIPPYWDEGTHSLIRTFRQRSCLCNSAAFSWAHFDMQNSKKACFILWNCIAYSAIYDIVSGVWLGYWATLVPVVSWSDLTKVSAHLNGYPCIKSGSLNTTVRNPNPQRMRFLICFPCQSVILL